MSLLKITTTPIEYEIKIERARLREKEQDFQEIKREQAAQIRKQQMAEYKVDPSVVKKAEKGEQNTAEYQNVARMRSAAVPKSTNAAQLSQISGQNPASDIAASDISLASDYSYPLGRIDFSSDESFSPVNFADYVSSVDIKGLIADGNNEWTVSKKEMEFVPGRFHMEITQFPKVTIEYLGNKENVKGE